MFKAKEKYSAKVIDAGLQPTKDGSPQAFMKFECSSAGETQSFYWTGSFKSEKATELTVKALVTAGFTGSDVSDLKQGLVMFMPREISVELEDNNGNLRVKWVNGPAKREAFSGATPKLAGAFAKAKAELGIKTNSDPNW